MDTDNLRTPTKKELKNLKKKELKNQHKIVRGYTEGIRSKIVTEFYINLSSLDILDILTDEIRTILNDYVKNGTEYTKNIHIPVYDRTLLIRLYNNKNNKSYINFQKENGVEENRNDKVISLNNTIHQLKNKGVDMTVKN
jgi:hypothetical protein